MGVSCLYREIGVSYSVKIFCSDPYHDKEISSIFDVICYSMMYVCVLMSFIKVVGMTNQ